MVQQSKRVHKLEPELDLNESFNPQFSGRRATFRFPKSPSHVLLGSSRNAAVDRGDIELGALSA